MSENDKRTWVPEICYEEYDPDALTGGLPFITVPNDKEMPNVLFFFGSRETGEFEPGLEGEPSPIVEMELYQFGCMKYLQENLDTETYDKVRSALGLLPLEEAREKGRSKAIKTAEEVQEKLKK